MDILGHNSKAWDNLVLSEDGWTRPVDSKVIEEARKGKFSLLLTPTKPVPQSWYPDLKNKSVLCLASGGGQQGPVLAAVGANVVTLDNSPEQLEQDRFVAQRDGLSLTTELGDMRDLSRFADESFDLIFHPFANCFIDDVKNIWRECYRVLKKKGVLLSGFGNPISYIFDLKEWDDNRNLAVRYKIPYSDIEQLPPKELAEKIKSQEALEFGHTLEDQIGGQIAAGFVISGFYEDNSGGDLLDEFIDSSIATRAVKL